MRPECPACGGRDCRPWRDAHQVAQGQVVSAPLELWRCGSCGSAWLPGRMDGEASDALHRGGPFSTGAGLAASLPWLAAIIDRDRLRLLSPLEPGSRVIEVGSGRGRLLAALRGRGHDAVGIEPSAAPGEDGVIAARVEDAALPSSQADRVVFWHSLEHLEQPAEQVRRAQAWLRPGGRVVVAAPNLASLQARLGGDRWFHQDVPRHRTQFTLDGLERILERAGLAITATRHLMLEQNAIGMWLTLLNGLTAARDVPFRALKRDLRYDRRGEAIRDALVTPLAGIPLLPVAATAELAAGFARRGGTVVVHAERR